MREAPPARYDLAIEVLDAAAADSSELAPWSDGILDAMSRLLPSHVGCSAAVMHLGKERAEVLHASTRAMPDEVVPEFKGHATRDKAMVHSFFFRGGHVTTTHDILRQVTSRERDIFDAIYRKRLGISDMVAIRAFAGSSHSMAISSAYPFSCLVPMPMQLLLSRIALHCEAGLRLRLLPRSLVGILRVDGLIEQVEGSARAVHMRHEIQSHVRQIEALRPRKARRQHDLIDGWTALVAGRYGFVHQAAGPGQRRYLVFEEPHDSSRRQLSALQARVLELSARGSSGKLTAYALGVSERVVSGLLAEAAQRLGCSSRVEAVGLAATLLDHSVPGVSAILTEAEQDIISLLALGLSNAQIAHRRGSATRTVANQVASVLRKAGVSGRRALAGVSTRVFHSRASTK